MATPTEEDFRAVGMTKHAAKYPRDDLAVAMFAAFNGAWTADTLPEALKYFPNEWTRAAWNRVAEAAIVYLSNPTD